MDRRALLSSLLLPLASPARPGQAQISVSTRPTGFFFRDGDRVVLIGDSITEQLLHTNYVETYVRSRFPRWQLAFRNVGIGGDTSTGGNRRTERDILSFEPTAVTITFGMNDGGYRAVDPARLAAYERGLQGIVEQLKPRGIRVAILSSSPVEERANGPVLAGYNLTLERFAAAAQQVAERNGTVFVDQFHPHAAALQRARAVDPALRINGGDAVHPGPAGQYLMAWAILKGLGAPPRISSAEVDAPTRTVREAENCAVHTVRANGGGIRFLRAEEAIPLHLPPAARPILAWAPIQEELNSYRLRVTGLEPRNYDLRVDGERCGTFRGPELAAGVNLAPVTEGPIARQAQAVFDAVVAKNRYYHQQIFRGVVLNNQVPAAEKAAQIRQREVELPKLEAAIREALVLRPHLFELIPAA
ncbi:MAG: SGNH/GDSL hydrolase family protein [Armatimonadetes bacterium]|nr:SGNH/GDSL hydrolase family protein [Armatimonadota bacterium]